MSIPAQPPPPPKSFARRLTELGLTLLVFGGLALLGVALWRLYGRSAFAPLPHVTVGLGDDWQTIMAHSTYRFRQVDPSRDGYSIDFSSVDFTYSDPAHRLELPNVTGILFQFQNQRVYRISISQYGDVTEWAPSAQRVSDLVTALERAGWKKAVASPSVDTRLERIQAYYNDPAHREFMSDQFLDSWREGDARLDIGFYRDGVAGDSYRGRRLAHDVFSVYITIVRDESA